MNFTPYLTISFLSILSAQIRINELDMTMSFGVVLFVRVSCALRHSLSLFYYAFELICLYIMCPLSAHLTVKNGDKRTV